MAKNRYSKEESEWLVKNLNNYSDYTQLLLSYNKLFPKRTKASLETYCRDTLRVFRKNSGKFGKDKLKGELPLLTERKTDKATYIKVQLVGNSRIKSYAEPHWLPKQKYIYEKFYNTKVSKSCFIIFLDGDNNNFDISNLYCIDRKISAIMAKNKWYTNNLEHTLVAIKWCELYFVLKNYIRRKR